MFDMTSIWLSALVPFVAITIVTLVIIVLALRWVSGMSAPNRQLLATGTSAQATIVNLWDTGTTVNENPLVGMLLQVEPPSGPAYQVKTSLLISRLDIPQYQPGRKLVVKVDPRNPQKVAIAGVMAPAQA